MNKNKTIYNYNFQHFPFHFIPLSKRLNLANSYLFNLQSASVGKNRTRFSTNYTCMEQKPLKEPLNSNKTKIMKTLKNKLLNFRTCFKTWFLGKMR